MATGAEERPARRAAGDPASYAAVRPECQPGRGGTARAQDPRMTAPTPTGIPSAATPPAPPAPDPPPFRAPPDHPAAVWERSVAELEGLAVDKGAYGLGSTAWLARALVSPLRQLGASELRLLLSHGRGLAWVAPLALERLLDEPFAAADYGPGALLGALLTVDPDRWDPAWTDRLARVVHAARTHLDLLPAPDRARLADDLDAAREQFGV
jgi:hypothetical protein